ncbi:hypothetical protein RRG08_008027 [Elysia crispata]|uniref:Uncharacterized protein n=1 Tax=Elysia crispata TaxID=231223 RepID=A0AAE1AHT0_9GAST|nr:hypothetical protein RRG08_008027 [Elysia crispata]
MGQYWKRYDRIYGLSNLVIFSWSTAVSDNIKVSHRRSLQDTNDVTLHFDIEGMGLEMDKAMTSLAVKNSLTSLSLQGNEIIRYGREAMTSLAVKNSLTSLWLQGNEIIRYGREAMTSLAVKNSLTSLSLQGNEIIRYDREAIRLTHPRHPGKGSK